jgi:hypothetical protein
MSVRFSPRSYDETSVATRTTTAAFAIGWHLATVVTTLPAQRASVEQRQASGARGTRARNPHSLNAVQLLARAGPGRDERVRFQWDQVDGAKGYLLIGRWTQPPSWTIQSRAYRVGATNATSSTSDHVTFEVLLPPGSHSWKVTALFGARLVGDTATATTFAFDIK